MGAAPLQLPAQRPARVQRRVEIDVELARVGQDLLEAVVDVEGRGSRDDPVAVELEIQGDFRQSPRVQAGDGLVSLYLPDAS